jgi:hypothetical protein
MARELFMNAIYVSSPTSVTYFSLFTLIRLFAYKNHPFSLVISKEMRNFANRTIDLRV